MKELIKFKFNGESYVPFIEDELSHANEFLNWLLDDVQFCEETIDELIDIAKSKIEFDDFGNAHNLKITQDKVILSNDYDNKSIEIKTNDFVNALEGYKDFLQSDNKSLKVIELNFKPQNYCHNHN